MVHFPQRRTPGRERQKALDGGVQGTSKRLGGGGGGSILIHTHVRAVGVGGPHSGCIVLCSYNLFYSTFTVALHHLADTSRSAVSQVCKAVVITCILGSQKSHAQAYWRVFLFGDPQKWVGVALSFPFNATNKGEPTPSKTSHMRPASGNLQLYSAFGFWKDCQHVMRFLRKEPKQSDMNSQRNDLQNNP